jgi:hypothetical protein
MSHEWWLLGFLNLSLTRELMDTEGGKKFL